MLPLQHKVKLTNLPNVCLLLALLLLLVRKSLFYKKGKSIGSKDRLEWSDDLAYQESDPAQRARITGGKR